MIQWQTKEPKPDIHIRKAALAKFLARMPDRLDIRLKLADQHLYLGEAQRAWGLLVEVQAVADSSPDWLICYGKVARALGHSQIAEDSFQQAWNGGSKAAGTLLAKQYGDQNRHDEAIALSKSMLQAGPTNHAAAMILCKSLVATGQLEALWDWAQACLQHHAYDAILPSALAYASTNNARAQMVEALVESDSNLICLRKLTAARPVSDLSDILLNHKARSDFPTIYAGKGEGKRIDGLLEFDIDEVDQLFDRIKEAVAKIDSNRSNPITADIPKAASIESWANVCTGDGHEDWHCHPAGWMSGVYYLEVPEGDEPGADEKAGQIEFGPLMLGEHNDLEAWPKTPIKPEKDMLLLFPSYFGHRTYPTQSREPRISIAFDIVPTVHEQDG